MFTYYLTENRVLPLERPGGLCCIGKSLSDSIMWNTLEYNVWNKYRVFIAKSGGTNSYH